MIKGENCLSSMILVVGTVVEVVVVVVVGTVVVEVVVVVVVVVDLLVVVLITGGCLNGKILDCMSLSGLSLLRCCCLELLCSLSDVRD